MSISGRIKAWGVAFAACLALLGGPPAQAITTPQILGQTIAAMPSCLSYQVKGMCFFLFCTWKGCTIRTSVRVSHYVPDAIVSTYNDPLMHPWIEVGKPLAAAMGTVGSAMLALPLDASGAYTSTAQHERELATFKSADAIGNPAGMIMAVVSSGTLPNLPNVFGVPGLSQIMAFPTQELPKIQQQWLSVPQQVGNNVLAGAANLAKLPTDILNKISSLPATLGQLQSAIGNVGQLMQSGAQLGQIAMSAQQLLGIDLGPLQQIANMASIASPGSPLGSLFCPGSASAFTLHFQSDLDSYFWRDVIPVELLYPASWVPTLDEVSTSPMINTWGGRYPRTGHLVQTHPVKASAVYAERVGSIIKKKAQPHIYTPLTPGSGFRYFNQMTDTRWQMLSPVNSGCHTFGTNDSVSLTSYGDGKTSSGDGYTWNMWNKYDCCQRRGTYLFSVP